MASAPDPLRFNVYQMKFDQRKWKEQDEALVRLEIVRPSTPKPICSWQKKRAVGDGLAAYFAYKWSKFNKLTISYSFDQEEVYLQFFSIVFGYEGLLSHVHFSYCNRKG